MRRAPGRRITCVARFLAMDRRGLTFRETVLLVLIFGGLAAIAIPNFKAARERDQVSPGCRANQRTILGAIEMYNLDKNTKRTVLDAGFFEDLKGKYLQSIPQDPGAGPGSEDHYQLTVTGITCTKHGPIPSPR